MDDAVNSWFRPHASEAAFWRDPATNVLPWHDWKALFTWDIVRDQVPAPGRTVYRSFTTLQIGQFRPPAGFELIDTWSREPFWLVWIHLPERIILSYAQGDLRYIESATAEALREVIRELNEAYRLD